MFFGGFREQNDGPVCCRVVYHGDSDENVAKKSRKFTYQGFEHTVIPPNRSRPGKLYNFFSYSSDRDRYTHTSVQRGLYLPILVSK